MTPLTGRVALGGAAMAIEGGPIEPQLAVIEAALEAGARILDTARAYAPVGVPVYGERLMATAARAWPETVIATKGGHFRTGEASWDVDNSPERLRRDLDLARATLGVEQVGVFYLHRADQGDVPLDESLGFLAEARRAGEIGAVGVSNVSRAQLDALSSALRPDAVQNAFSVFVDDSADVLEWCERHEVAFFAYSPLGGRARAGSLDEALPRLAALAHDRALSLPRLVLRGLLSSSPVLSVVSGAGRPESARDAASAEAETWDAHCAAAWDADVAALHAAHHD